MNSNNPIAYILPWNGEYFPVNFMPISSEIMEGLIKEIDQYTMSGIRFFESQRFDSPNGYLIYHATHTQANKYSHYFWSHGTISFEKPEHSELYVSAATAQGSRDHQEDRHIAKKLTLFNGHDSLMLLAVMDGHSGDEVSEFLLQSFEPIFAKVALNPKEELPDWQEVLTIQMVLLSQMTKDMRAGSTLSVVLLPSIEQKAYVGIIGDSPVIIAKPDKIIISPEHNAISNEKERMKAISKGATFDGHYLRDETGVGLQLSRTLGDRQFSFLTREPDVYAVDLDDHDFILVASDGLLDPAHGDTVTVVKEIINLVYSGADAQKIVDNALERQTGDNVTVVLAKPFGHLSAAVDTPRVIEIAKNGDGIKKADRQ